MLLFRANLSTCGIYPAALVIGRYFLHQQHVLLFWGLWCVFLVLRFCCVTLLAMLHRVSMAVLSKPLLPLAVPAAAALGLSPDTWHCGASAGADLVCTERMGQVAASGTAPPACLAQRWERKAGGDSKGQGTSVLVALPQVLPVLLRWWRRHLVPWSENQQRERRVWEASCSSWRCDEHVERRLCEDVHWWVTVAFGRTEAATGGRKHPADGWANRLISLCGLGIGWAVVGSEWPLSSLPT